MQEIKDKERLPVHGALPELKKALRERSAAVLQAPPGAGKTTLVPLALLDEPWIMGKKIVMLEPRRLAARSSAWRMAWMLGESVGETVGYQVRMDRKIGANTRVEVITEGIFIRRIQQDPSLESVGLVIFDEFHERSLDSDLGLAFCLEAAGALREDLRILVMSATMDPQPISSLMGDVPVILSPGKSFPVETFYKASVERHRKRGAVEAHCCRVVMQALREQEGDILVFLPGAGEIRRLEKLLTKVVDENISVMPLFASLSQGEQAMAILPSVPGRRKIVIATSIAETSITIQGVRIVIDSGLMRVPRFFSGTGMTRLETDPVSKASADQRRGRAGRVESGVCYRLWSQASQQMLKPFTPPEILNTDLSGFILELAAWGVKDSDELKWLDPPPSGAVERAGELLIRMGAMDESGHITSHGKRMAGIGAHPRLAHMIIRAEGENLGRMACMLAAVISERDFISFMPGQMDADIRLRLEIMQAIENGNRINVRGFTVNRKRAMGILKTAKNLMGSVGVKKGQLDLDRTGFLLALAYPERVARRRDNSLNTFVMASGAGIALAESCSLGLNEWIVAAHLDGRAGNAKLFLGASYSAEALEEDFGNLFERQNIIEWDPKFRSVLALTRIRYGSILIRQLPFRPKDPDLICDAMIQGIRKMGLGSLPWTKSLESLRERIAFLRDSGGLSHLPDLSDSALGAGLETWLKPFLSGILSASRLSSVDLNGAMAVLLPWKVQREVETLAPTHFTVPSGSKIPLRYTLDGKPLESPVLPVRLQEMFGLKITPMVAGGRIPVTVHLLSPAGRPVQITQDLESFWANGYIQVKKDLMGRYPKHYWPDNPLDAAPTARIKKRR